MNQSFKKANKLVLFSILAAAIVPLILFTNASRTSVRYEEKSMQCLGLSSLGAGTIGVKSESHDIVDCARVSSAEIDLSQSQPAFLGVELMGASLSGEGEATLHLRGSTFFNLKSDGKEVNALELKKSALVEPQFTDSVILSGKFEDSVLSANSVSETPQFVRSEMRRVSFRNTRLENLKFERFTGHRLQFDSTLFQNTEFANARLFDVQVATSQVCGAVSFEGAYFSRSDVNLSSTAKCLSSTDLSFAKANLRGSTLRVKLDSRSRANFDGADLRGADLAELQLTSGQWSFKNAVVDSSTRLPAGFFTYQSQLSRAQLSHGLQPKEVR